MVLTEWDWATPTMYLHDTISTDKRNPTVNAHGLIYGAPEVSSDDVPWLDPVDNKSGFIKSEFRDPKTPTSKTATILAPSPYWGNEPIWDSHTIIHNPMFDEKGPRLVDGAHPSHQYRACLLREGLGPRIGQGLSR